MYQIVLTTCPDKETGLAMARTLVEEKLAACINIIDNITSIYQWQGEMQQGTEVQLVIKTLANNFDAVRDRINQLHSYEIAEILAVDIQKGDKHYLQWVSESLA
ncbi:divalent-cation tolerance protein CutA [Thalassotalea agarivorans]|uniref:Divalent cation tolerance protein n=1 Tax=Thalassotalea agarivorans TaxID=349064 RepID=A0A1I0GL67_THASX|nr:divalent-cation tolerance protein CutA [Thalassotalea agarivorans]SET70921.1 divalent cation tolerance protein [Thalassotalea agarivorans]